MLSGVNFYFPRKPTLEMRLHVAIHPLSRSLKQKISHDFICGIRDMSWYLYAQGISGHTTTAIWTQAKQLSQLTILF
jgi:hypothetical protein